MSNGKGGFIGQDGLNAPDPATGVSGAVGDTAISVAFTAPVNEGASDITGYRVTDSTGAHGASGTSSPINVTGLTNDTSYSFNVWAINPFGYSSPSKTASATPLAAAWAMVVGFGSGTNVIERYSLNSTGDSSDFGDLTSGRNSGNVMSSATRTVFSCGRDGGTVFFNILDYVNPNSAGNATDFGDASYAKQFGSQFGSSTRGCVGGAEGGNQGAPKYQAYDTIDFITFASTGNASDFGNQTQITQVCAGFGSPTRGVRSGGYDGAGGGSVETNTMDFVTIASEGNATDFGDMTLARRSHGSCSSSTRGLNAGGFTGSTNTNSIDFVTIASTGNATDFGDVGTSGQGVRGASSQITATFIKSKAIDFVTIATTGNSLDFGNLSANSSDAFMTNSNAHGGVQ
tara:strand:- start:1741 stop:2943 length:1203 start_codon:yes stop_codon:yes gene_type:complete